MTEVTEKDYAIEIKGGVTVHVPADINLMTPYILLEQEDWFEDEIKFIRTYLRPGMRVVDIGVNYGTYFLTAAKKVGETGKVWGFEPSSQCCEFVERSIAKNGFQNTALIKAGLSDRVGSAFLSTGANTELNTVADSLGENQEGESIELLTLDHCMDDLELKDIDFMKIDAEGEESNIIRGGSKFFRENSPLVMFELKHGDSVNKKLIDEFIDIGYKTYRLVPGLNCLVSFDLDDPIDGYQLNLFCCKQQKAEKLHQDEVLVDESVLGDSDQITDGLWIKYLSQYPYFKTMSNIFGDAFNQSSSKELGEYYRALDLYAFSHSNKKDTNKKYNALVDCKRILEDLNIASPNISIALTLARVSTELGYRVRAVEILGKIIELMQSGVELNFPVPFLSPVSLMDNIKVDNEFEKWIQASIFVSHQLLAAFSSYYMQPENINSLLFTNNIGIDVPEIRKRIFLTTGRFNYSNANSYLANLGRIEGSPNFNVWKEILSNLDIS